MSRVTGHAGPHHVRQVGNGIGTACVLGQRVVVQVKPPCLAVDGHVLQDRAEATGGLVDLRLRLGAETDHLGVAATFEVEHPLVAPPVLVVADEGAVRGGREGRLAGARQAEEDGHVALRPLIGRAVHGEHSPLRQHVVQDAEDRLLDLAGVVGAPDEDAVLTEVQDHERLGVRSVHLRTGVEMRRGDDDDLRPVHPRRGRRSPDEHIAGEQAVPGRLGDHPNRDAIERVSPDKAVLNEEVPSLQVRQEPLVEALELLGIHGPVDGPPPNAAGAGGLADDELVVRANGRCSARCEQRGGPGGLSSLPVCAPPPRRAWGSGRFRCTAETFLMPCLSRPWLGVHCRHLRFLFCNRDDRPSAAFAVEL